MVSSMYSYSNVLNTNDGISTRPSYSFVYCTSWPWREQLYGKMYFKTIVLDGKYEGTLLQEACDCGDLDDALRTECDRGMFTSATKVDAPRRFTRSSHRK